jgi:hypothetical protein
MNYRSMYFSAKRSTPDAPRPPLRPWTKSMHCQEMSHYARIVPIAQSSGTGSTKIVDKIATERIRLPICLREDLLGRYFGRHPHYRSILSSLPSNLDTRKEQSGLDLPLSSWVVYRIAECLPKRKRGQVIRRIPKMTAQTNF